MPEASARHRRGRTAVLIVLSVGIITTVIVALSTQSGGSGGRIAFYSDRDGNMEIYVMNADGSQQTRLTRDPAEDRDPVWSPDGRRIAFVSRRDGNSEIYTMASDGSEVRRLTNDPLIDSSPVWSPSGQQIAFVSSGGKTSDIFVMSADGTGRRQLTRDADANMDPAWSPDGKRLAFVSNRDIDPTEVIEAFEHAGEIYVMNADGSAQTRLTKDEHPDAGPVWSPAGTHILYFSPSERQNEMWIIPAQGGTAVNVTAKTRAAIFPAWSPQGDRIAFIARADSPNQDVYVMNADGTGLRNVSRRPEAKIAPLSWSPDGGQVLYSIFENGNWEVYAAAADGSRQTRLTTNRFLDLGARWAPPPVKPSTESGR